MRILGKWFMVCGIVLTCLVVNFASSFGASPGTAQKRLSPEIKKQVEQELSVLAEEISRKAPLDKEAIFALLSDYLQKDPSIYGAAFAFAPKKEAGKLIKSSPYVYRSGEQLLKKDLIESYDYTSNQKWYSAPVKQKKPVWSKPYYDAGGGEAWMVTYSIPVYASGKKSQLIGVVTSDVLVSKR